MSQVHELLGALKTALKQRGITYAEVAAQLGLSESSVKRLFATGGFKLDRLQQICDLAEVDIAELARIVEARRRDVAELTEEQEQLLVANVKLLLVAFLLLNDWTFEQIVGQYAITETEGIRLLAQLDRLKIIELQPGNKVRMRVSRSFHWRAHGPIQRFFEEQVQTEFFKSRFNAKGELRIVINGMLSDRCNRLLQRSMERLAAEFESLVQEDRKLDLKERRGTTLIAAIRPWGLGIFEQLRR